MGLRSALAMALSAVFAVLLPAAITAMWVRGTVISTSGYAAAVAPLAADPAVRGAVRAAAAGEIDVVLNRAVSTLPSAAVLLTGPLRRGLARLAGDEIDSVMGSPAFQKFWLAATTFAHHQLIGVLDGDGTAGAARDGEVVLNLTPFIGDVLESIARRLSELTGTAITRPAISRIHGAGCTPIASVTRDRLSAGCWPILLFPVSALARARLAYRLLSAATLALLLLAPAAGAAALLAAPRRRRALVQLAVGGAAAIQVASIVVSRLQSSLIARAQPRFQPAATSILQALTRGLFTLAGWCVIGSLVLATVALLSGLRSDRVPPPWGGGIGRVLGRIPSCGRGAGR
jgi:hypothetical protein